MKGRKNDEHLINYGGRSDFLQAAEAIWEPKPLATLVSKRGVVVKWLVLRYPQHMQRHAPPLADSFAFAHLWRMPWPFRWSALCDDRSEEAKAARTRLEQWRGCHPISTDDVWIMDAAIHSIAHSARRSCPLKWAYSPDQDVIASFRANLPAWKWHPNDGNEAAKEIERKLIALLRRQWRAYLSRIRKHYGEVKPRGRQVGKNMFARDAIWAAKACLGKSFNKISIEAWEEEAAAGVPELNRTIVDEDTVGVAVRRFARKIGLHLPNPRLKATRQGQ